MFEYLYFQVILKFYVRQNVLQPTNFVLKFDHNQFPGVVPRTFIGPILVALVSKPFVNLALIYNDNLMLAQLIGAYY